MKIKRMTKKQMDNVQSYGRKVGIRNLGSAIKMVTDHMATPECELSVIDRIILNSCCVECKGRTVTVSCVKLKRLGKCRQVSVWA